MTKLDLALIFVILILLAVYIGTLFAKKEAEAEIFDLKVANRHLQQQIRQARIHMVSRPPDKLFDQDPQKD